MEQMGRPARAHARGLDFRELIAEADRAAGEALAKGQKRWARRLQAAADDARRRLDAADTALTPRPGDGADSGIATTPADNDSAGQEPRT